VEEIKSNMIWMTSFSECNASFFKRLPPVIKLDNRKPALVSIYKNTPQILSNPRFHPKHIKVNKKTGPHGLQF